MTLLPHGLALRFPRRLRLSFAAILMLIGLSAACAPSIHDRNAVHLLKANSEVNPVMERYIDRGIDEAERTDAKAVVIRLDTPGGLETSMEHIVQRIQSSKVPVIVYVSPSGAKAASAGTFITMSAHVAAMAPGTSIGAAHPVDSSGGDIGGTLGQKVENNAAAYARSIADARGRNADWAGRAVRDSVSASTNDAVDQHPSSCDGSLHLGSRSIEARGQHDVESPGIGSKGHRFHRGLPHQATAAAASRRVRRWQLRARSRHRPR